MEHRINASGKVLGRLATEVAIRLRGKHLASFAPHRFSDQKVVVYNTDKILITGKKISQKLYRHHTGFHGGLKEESMEDRMARDSRLVVLSAVKGMLPKNKLRDRWIKNLVLIKGEK